MRRLIILLFVLIGYTVEAQIISQPDAYTLDQRDLFIITEYKETEYQVFVDHDSLNLPANLSTVNYYVDINDQTDSSNMIDINYLYLQGYHEAKKTSGQLFYLITQKTIPVGNRKTNVRGSKSVDQYSQLSSIESMSFGYWQLDTITHRIFIVYRESTKIWNMDNFRVFAGLVANKNIYITKSMDTKDTYLFDYNFKRNKEVYVKLPVSLENVLYSEPVLTGDTIQIKKATYSLLEARKKLVEMANSYLKDSIYTNRIIDSLKVSSDDSEDTFSKNSIQIKHALNELKESKQQFNKANPKKEMLTYLKNEEMNEQEADAPNHWDSVKKSKRTNLIRDERKDPNTVNAAIKFSYYPSNKAGFINRKMEYMNYDTLSFTCLKKRGGRASKYVLLRGIKDDIFTYSQIKLKRYRKYYSTDNQQEFIFINVVDPYDEKVFHTFKVPYSSKGALPRILNFFKKKIFNA